MLFICLLIGMFSGILSGLLGIGGGIFLVPSLLAIFSHIQIQSEVGIRYAVATSLATMSFTAFFAILSHAKYTQIKWRLVIWVVAGTLMGATFGAWLVGKVPEGVLRLSFSLLCIYVALRLLRVKLVAVEKRVMKEVPYIVYTLIGICVGTISVMLGIGGGLLLVPLLIWFGAPMSQAGAISITCTFPTVLMGALGNMFVTIQPQAIALDTIGYVVWPIALAAGFGALIGVPIGVKLLHFLPEKTTKKIFSVILLLVAWQMFPTLW